MGFEMPVDVDYFDHPKTLDLIAILGKQEADIYPLRLWKWAAKYSKRGILSGQPAQIEVPLRWKGPPGRLQKALIDAGFVEPDGKAIHDWMKGIGRAILIYDEKKRKQREVYARKHGILPEEFPTSYPYSGGEGVEDREGRTGKPGSGYSGGEGGNRPPAPPDQAAPGDDGHTPTRQGDPGTEADVTPDPERTGQEQGNTDPFELDLWAFSAFRTPGKHHKREAFEDLVRQGVTHERIRQAAQDHSDWDFYEVVKALRNGRGKQGEGRPNPPKRPPEPPRGEIQRQRDEARAAVDAKLAELPAEQITAWTREAEEQAAANKVHPEHLKQAVTMLLRVRAAKEFGIEGL